MTSMFRTWTGRSGEVRHYFTGNVGNLLGIEVSLGVIDTVGGKDVTGRDRSRLTNSVRAFNAWVDADGRAHVTGWDSRVEVLTTADVLRAVESAYAAK